MTKRILILFLVGTMLIVTGCKEEEPPELLFYIGITMVKPVTQLANEFEEKNNCKITIVQGGSQDLYDSLKLSQVGDLYMPGSYSYRKNNLEDGLLLDAVVVGYNKASLMVAEGNPMGFTADLNQLADSNNKVVICNPESGSIGRETKRILDEFGNYEAVFDNSIYLTTDSRNLTDAIVNGDADLVMNWYATAVWPDNKDKVDAILIDEVYGKKMLVMSLTSCSIYPELTKAFMEYASSDHGQDVFEEYGFIDGNDREEMEKVELE